MATQLDLLSEIASKLSKQTKNLCCKLDSVILALGGSPVSYNTYNSTVVAPSDVYSSPEAHAITISVIGGAGDEANVTVNGGSQIWPSAYNVSISATTVFPAGHVTVESSTATVIIGTLTAA